MPDGSVYVLRRSARDSDGALVEMEFVLPGGCVAPPPHVHRHQVEQYEVRNWHRPAMRFEEFIERTSEVLRAAGVKRKRDPRVPLYLSMVMLEFDETLAPGRRRERLPMLMLARIARRLPAAGTPAYRP